MLINEFVLQKLFIFLVLSISCETTSYVCDKDKVPCGCSRTNVGIHARIVNGEDAIEGSWSMIVSLRDTNVLPLHNCGGTILTESYILTAAHCVDMYVGDATAGDISIVADVHDLQRRNQTVRQVDKIIIHPLWNKLKTVVLYDIALLHLAQPLDLQANSSLSRVCLPPRQNLSRESIEYPVNGTRLVAIGWGTLSYSGVRPQILQQVTLYSMHHSMRLCSDTIHDPSIHLCAGWLNGSKSLCVGDSGGPVFQWLGDRWEQVGISSYVTNRCGINNYPSIFTRISYFHDWIQSHILNRNSTNITDHNRDLYQCSNELCGCSRQNVVLSPARFSQSENALPFTWSMVVSVRLRTTNQHLCSGTILDESNILTAAHCVHHHSTQDLIIAAGMYILSDSDAIFRQVQRIVTHPNYTTNDLAVLHLAIPLDRYDSRDIAQTCLPSMNNSSNYSLVVTGWNLTDNFTFINPEILQQSEINSIEHLENRCNGDPIFQWNGYRWVQVGLASYCNRSDRVDVYTNLAQYSTWIKSSMISITEHSSTIFQCDRKASCGCSQIDVNMTTSGVTHVETVAESSWSMIVSIQYENKHHCIGTVLSDLFILTSSMCVRSFNINETRIVAGTENIRREVAQIYHYESFPTFGLYRHDIAILELNQSLFVSDGTQKKVSKTCLSNNENFFQNFNSSLAVIGWDKSTNQSDILKQVSMKLLDDNHRSCLLNVYNKTYQFCARPSNNNPYLDIFNSNFSAHGGPVMIYINNHWEQIGFVPTTYGDNTDSLRVYTRLLPYIDWIKQIINTDASSSTTEQFQTTTLASSSNRIMNNRQLKNLVFNIIAILIVLLF